VIARRSGVEESSAATTAKRSVASAEASDADDALRTLSSEARAAANDWRLAPPNAESAVVMITCSSPSLQGSDRRCEIDGPGHPVLLRRSSMLALWQERPLHFEVTSRLVGALLRSKLAR